MTSRDTTIIAIKILLIWILIDMIIESPNIAMYTVELSSKFAIETLERAESHWYVFWMLVLSIPILSLLVYLLHKLLNSLIDGILRTDAEKILVRTKPFQFELTILSVLGLYFFVNGLSVVTFDIYWYQKNSDSTFLLELGMEGFMKVFSYVIEIVIGIVLMLFPKKASLFLLNIRRDY